MNPEELFRKIKEALISINFSSDEADRQLKELSDVIMVVFQQKLEEFKGDKKDKVVITQLLVDSAAPIINDYFKEVSRGLGESKKKEFFSKLNNLTAS